MGDTIASASISELLAAWRAAERRWERPASADEVRAAAGDVIRSWTAYQDAALGDDPGEFMLVADDEGAYVAATAGVEVCLGYRPDALIGMHIADLADRELRDTTPSQWAAFLAAGRQDGQFRLRAVDGRSVTLRYQARAHHPVPGYHMSRLWPEQQEV
jgi:PAS domain S-box-containing protein